MQHTQRSRGSDPECILIGCDLERLSAMYISTTAFCVLHITGTIVRDNAFVHDSVAVGRAWLKVVHNHLVDLADREHSVSSRVVILWPLRIIKMGVVIRGNLDPAYRIDISSPDDCESGFRHALHIWSAYDLISGLLLLCKSHTGCKNQHRCQ